jgi:hypothetical protein
MREVRSFLSKTRLECQLTERFGENTCGWILLARDRRVLERFTKEPRWDALDGRLGGDLWTDEFSDVLRVLHWR